jgi:hypothetical protein
LPLPKRVRRYNRIVNGQAIEKVFPLFFTKPECLGGTLLLLVKICFISAIYRCGEGRECENPGLNALILNTLPPPPPPFYRLASK